MPVLHFWFPIKSEYQITCRTSTAVEIRFPDIPVIIQPFKTLKYHYLHYNCSVCENSFFLICLPSTKKSKSPSHRVVGVFALEVNKILQATPPKLRREMGMCATTRYVQQQQYYTIRVLVVRTRVPSLSFQAQHTWYIRPGRHAHTRHVSDTYVEVSVGAQALSLPIRRGLKKEKREKCSLQKYLVRPGALHSSTQQTR